MNPYRVTATVALGVSIAIVFGAAIVIALILSAESHHLMRSVDHQHADTKGVESSFYAEMANVNARMHAGMEIAPSSNVDRDFAQMMIPHHQGAIDMARVFLKYGRDERLRRLAQAIIVEQGQEINYMRMLQEPPPAQSSASGHIAGQ
jgi:uncharacterized protein (DUF305 family)